MGTCSYVLTGTQKSMELSFGIVSPSSPPNFRLFSAFFFAAALAYWREYALLEVSFKIVSYCLAFFPPDFFLFSPVFFPVAGACEREYVPVLTEKNRLVGTSKHIPLGAHRRAYPSGSMYLYLLTGAHKS